MRAQLLSHVWLLTRAPWTVARQASLSMGFYRQEYWSGFSCLSSQYIPKLGIEPASPALGRWVLYCWATREAPRLVQFSSVTWSCPTLCGPMDCSMPDFPSITNSQSLLKHMSIESVMPANHLILCHPLLLLPSIFRSIRVFSNKSVLCIRWPKYWSFSFSISPSNEYSGLIFFRIDWFDLLAVQGALKSFLQHHSSKASILRCSALTMT